METDLYILNIDTLYKNPSPIPIDPLTFKSSPPSTNDPNGYNTGIIVPQPTADDPERIDPNSIQPYYNANAGNYLHVLSEPIKNVIGCKLSSFEFPNVNFIFSQAKGTNYFTLIIPKDRLNPHNEPLDTDYDQILYDTYNDSDEENNQFAPSDPYKLNPVLDKKPYRITIVIPDGIYSYVTLLDQIQSIFNNINNATNAYLGQQSTHISNQKNYSSYPDATLNLQIWYNLVTFKVTITNTDLTFNKLLKFGMEFPPSAGQGPALPYMNYKFEIMDENAYGINGGTPGQPTDINLEEAAKLTITPPTGPAGETYAQAPFLPIKTAVPKRLGTHPFDSTFNKGLGYLLGFRKTFYKWEDCNVQAGTDHQVNGGVGGTGAIIANTIYPNQPSIPIQIAGNPTAAPGIPPAMGWISESPLDTQGENYLLMKINEYGNIVHENNPVIFDQIIGYAKGSDGKFLIDQTTNSYIPIKRRVYSREQDKYFAKILLVSGKGNIIFDTGANFLTKSYNFRQPTDIKKLHITLHEPNGDIINLQGFDYSLTLEFTYIVSSILKNNLEAGLLTLPNSLLTYNNDNNNIIPNPNNEITMGSMPIVSNKYINKPKDKKNKKDKKKFDITY